MVKKDSIFKVGNFNDLTFTFNEEVTEVFEDMIDRSVPGYTSSLRLIENLSRKYFIEGTHCYDLGCSLGASSMSLIKAMGKREGKIFAIDNSPAMIAACEQEYADLIKTGKVKFIKQDVKSLDEVNSDIIIVTTGCWTKELLPDIPIEPQKHTVFNIKCPTHMPDMPLTADFTTNIYWRPEGHGYIVGSPNGRFNQDDLEPDWNDFESEVWPAMAMRAPMFEELKLENAWAGYYDTNVLDNNAVVGKHPKMDNVYLASGFTGRGLMEAPGIGRGLMELITTGKYQSIDLTCFDPCRVLNKEKRLEPYVI